MAWASPCQPSPAEYGAPGDGVGWAANLRERFLAVFERYESVALLYATAFSEDLQHMLMLERWLTGAGHRTVLGSVAHLTRGWRGPKVFGTPIDAAFRFYPGEWMPKLPNLDTWRRVGPSLPMMNPLGHLVRQSKTMFALWREDGYLSPEDRDVVERHCPLTMAFDPASAADLTAEREHQGRLPDHRSRAERQDCAAARSAAVFGQHAGPALSV